MIMILKDAVFQDNINKERFELYINGSIAFVEYIRDSQKITIFNTVIPYSIAIINDIAVYFIDKIVEYCNASNIILKVNCPLAKAIINRNCDLKR